MQMIYIYHEISTICARLFIWQECEALVMLCTSSHLHLVFCGKLIICLPAFSLSLSLPLNLYLCLLHFFSFFSSILCWNEQNPHTWGWCERWLTFKSITHLSIERCCINILMEWIYHNWTFNGKIVERWSKCDAAFIL